MQHAVAECAHLAGGAAGRGLTGKGEGAVAGLGNLAHEQVHVVAQAVYPYAAGVLVEAHGPQGHDLLLGVGIGLGQAQQLVLGYAGELGRLLQGVGFHGLGVFLESDLARRP